jgi:hypothetical protein
MNYLAIFNPNYKILSLIVFLIEHNSENISS